MLHSFNGTDGAWPQTSLIFDAAGNLYGTTHHGGVSGQGTVFELTPTGGGGWTEKVLYNFGKGTDGAAPEAGLIFDAAGNLYGTTTFGVSHDRYGTVFELSPTAGGNWTEKVLHSFGSGADGTYPMAGLVFDTSGNLYGTCSQGGAYGGWGIVFQLTPQAGGGWGEQVLHNFSDYSDGSTPYAGLIIDVSGNLYGTTSSGGDYYEGTVFELSHTAGGGWTHQVLHSFNYTDGGTPQAGLTFDAAGNLYGTAGGGYYGYGTVFELTPTAGGGWTEQVLHSFNGTDGAGPQAGLIFDADGNLYGTTAGGGTYNDGTVFELTPLFPCARCSHAVSSGEVDVLPAESRDVLEQGGLTRR